MNITFANAFEYSQGRTNDGCMGLCDRCKLKEEIQKAFYCGQLRFIKLNTGLRVNGDTIA